MWYGLHALHCLTQKGKWELQIDFTFSNGTKLFLHYNHFKMGPATDNYRLSISGFIGITPTDPFLTHSLNSQQFSTYDKDNDQSNSNCALNGHGKQSGGWWHKSCNHINLNYKPKGAKFIYLGSKWYDPKFIKMKLCLLKCQIY